MASVLLVWTLVFLCLSIGEGQAQTASGTWRASDMTTARDNTSRMIWLAPEGRFAFWALGADGARTKASQLYGPIITDGKQWTPKVVSVGGDGLTRVMLVRSDGYTTVWTLDANLNLASSSIGYGPRDGWSAIDFAVAGDNSQRILWRRNDGAMGMWMLSSTGAVTMMSPNYGPFPGWTPRALAVNGDGKTRVLWSHVDGRADVWIMRADGSHEGVLSHAARDGWTAIDIALDSNFSSDLKSRVLWRRENPNSYHYRQSLFTKLGHDGNSEEVSATHGAYDGWTVSALGVGGDGLMSALWLHDGGQASFWRLSPDGLGYSINVPHGPLPLRVAAPEKLSATPGNYQATPEYLRRKEQLEDRRNARKLSSDAFVGAGCWRGRRGRSGRCELPRLSRHSERQLRHNARWFFVDNLFRRQRRLQRHKLFLRGARR